MSSLQIREQQLQKWHGAKRITTRPRSRRSWKKRQKPLREPYKPIQILKERDEIEGQRQKGTSELKKLREKHEALVKRLCESEKKLSATEEDLTNANARINMIAIEKSGLDLAIGALNRAARNHNSTIQRAKAELRQEQKISAALQAENSDLRAQLTVSQAMSNLFAASTRASSETQTAIADLRNLQRSNDRLNRDYSQLVRDYDEAKKARDLMETEYRDVLRRQTALEKILDASKETVRLKDQLISHLTSENSDLKQNKDLLGPLVKIGVDIRLRNLEFARETTLDVPSSDLDRAIILSGNVAAHRANGAVDAAIFEAGLVPDGCIEEASKVFMSLYLCQPSQYPTQWGSQIKRVLDCRATIKTVKAVAGSAGCSNLENEHSSLDLELCTLHDDMWVKEDFQADPSVEERLLGLEEITEDIVDIKRSKGGRRRRARFSDVDYYSYDDDDDE
ncbi:hypothetical protein ONS95_008320 [Cadophora gregata]|uniref:uncharacterized protein n=1 Tax=Cadophora gregata TaxID=51156 RepID=UPI0026DD388B|nr:uncharacterized protein ONS95_008320 [Cadophora gregata]KAK0100366.1 hypothetical protein ONS96_007646 [Cadophora gregata f. sp. sojae]KAK0126740.1 hypothetical protein ONS95_008320 [Cadophora gregata]